MASFEVIDADGHITEEDRQLKLVGLMLPAVGLRLPLGHESFWPIYEDAGGPFSRAG